MKKLTLILTTFALAATVVNAADDKATRREREKVRGKEGTEGRQSAVDIDKRITAVNRLDNNPQAFRAGLQVASRETAVPGPTFEAEHKQHPKVGLAGLFIAHELSVRTHKSVDAFLKQHASGKSWTQIARENNESLDTLDAKLARIEDAMKSAK